MRIGLLPFVLLGAVLLLCGVSPAHAREIPDIETDLTLNARELSRQEAVVDDVEQRERLQLDGVTQARGTLSTRRQATADAEAKLRDVQDFMVRNPQQDISLDAERTALNDARQAESAAAEALAAEEAQLRPLQQQGDEARDALEDLQDTRFALQTELAVARRAALRAQLEQEQTVEVRSEVSCGDMSIGDCRQASLNEARRQAIELSSVNVVESITQVENYALTRDEIRSQVRGLITQMDVLDSGLIGESGYFHAIRATVRPQVPDDLFGPLPVADAPPVRRPRGGAISAGVTAPPPAENTSQAADSGSADAAEDEPTISVPQITLYVLPIHGSSTVLTATDGSDISGADYSETVASTDIGFAVRVLTHPNLTWGLLLSTGTVDDVTFTDNSDSSSNGLDKTISASGTHSSVDATLHYTWHFIDHIALRVGGGLFNSSTTYRYDEVVLGSGGETDWTLNTSGVSFSFESDYRFDSRVVLGFWLQADFLHSVSGSREEAYAAEGLTTDSSGTRVGFSVGYALPQQ